MEGNFNRLTAKALLLDTITFLKFGQHLSPTFAAAKTELCKLAGYPYNISSKTLLKVLQDVYTENNLKEDFDEVVKKFSAQKFLNS